jgi:hypothetical protein
MRMKLPDDSPVEYWLKAEKIQNFGDYLTEFFMHELFYPIGMKARAIGIIGSAIAIFSSLTRRNMRQKTKRSP